MLNLYIMMKDFKRVLVLTLVICLCNIVVLSQNFDLSDKAALNIVSETKGILIPRLTQEQRLNIKPSEAEDGLIVYQTDLNYGLYFFSKKNMSWNILSYAEYTKILTIFDSIVNKDDQLFTYVDGEGTSAFYVKDLLGKGHPLSTDDTFTNSKDSEVSSSLAIKEYVSRVANALDIKKLDANNFGKEDGYAKLDVNNRIPNIHLPTVEERLYQGLITFSADGTPTPLITFTVDNTIHPKGSFFFVSEKTVSNSVTIFNQAGETINFNAGDRIITDGTIWERVTGMDRVIAVNGKFGDVTLNNFDTLSITNRLTLPTVDRAKMNSMKKGAGALVFQTDEVNGAIPGVYVFSGTKWEQTGGGHPLSKDATFSSIDILQDSVSSSYAIGKYIQDSILVFKEKFNTDTINIAHWLKLNNSILITPDSASFNKIVHISDSLDMSLSRIMNVADPFDQLDAINLKTLNDSIAAVTPTKYTDSTFAVNDHISTLDSIPTPYAIRIFVQNSTMDDWHE